MLSNHAGAVRGTSWGVGAALCTLHAAAPIGSGGRPLTEPLEVIQNRRWRMNIIKKLQRNHLAVAFLLFAVAAALYTAGLRLEAVALFVLGAAVEVAAWVALLTDRSEGSFPAKE